MKQLRKAVVFASLMILACAAGAWGYPVDAGNIIYIADGIGSTGGGEFKISTSSGGPTVFRTFCVELDEYINFSSGFYINEISDTAQAGGNNTDAGDPLSIQTKWLFWQYNALTLGTFGTGYQYNSAAGADALQLAFWKLEDELTGTSNNAAYYLNLYNHNTLAQALVALANGNSGNFSGDVMVMNLAWGEQKGPNAQSLLIASNSRDIPDPVPEPSTLLLTGLGLVGVAYLRRRRKA